MINIKDTMVPTKYRNSRDYQVLLILLNLIINACKEDVDNFTNLLNPSKCPDNMLPLLSEYIGYDYDYNDSCESNRTILENYNNLMHNKGNKTGILLASILSLSCEDIIKKVDKSSLFRVEYNKYKTDSDGNYILSADGKKQLNDTIYLYVYYPSYLKKLRDLVELVRPVGFRIRIIPALSISANDKIQVYDYVKFDSEEYSTSKRSEIVNPDVDIHEYEDNDTLKHLNRIGFGEVDNYNKGEN